MKNLFKFMLISLITISSIIPTKAEENDDTNKTYTETFTINEIHYRVTIKDNTSTVYVSESDKIHVIEYNGDEQTLFIDGENLTSQIQFSNSDINNSLRHISGQSAPLRYYFDVNPTSVGVIVGTILAIATIANAALASGLSLQVFGTGISTWFDTVQS